MRSCKILMDGSTLCKGQNPTWHDFVYSNDVLYAIHFANKLQHPDFTEAFGQINNTFVVAMTVMLAGLAFEWALNLIEDCIGRRLP